MVLNQTDFQMEQLKDKINKTRKEMELKAKECNYNFIHPDVLQLSQHLDQLILNYFSLRKVSRG